MPSKANLVRFQVPVTEDVATAIDRLAKGLDRSSAWLSVELLEISLEEREKFAEWIALAFVGKAYEVIKGLAGRPKRQAPSEKEVRLQLSVSPELVEKLTKLANQLQQSPVKVAGMLLSSAVHHHEPFIEFVTTKWVKAAVKRIKGGKPKQSPKATDSPCV